MVQVPETIPVNTVLGRLGIDPGPPQALPISLLQGGGGGGGISSAAGLNTQIQFNGMGVLAADPGFTYLGNGQATLALGTLTASATALNITATWNNGSAGFTAPLQINVTNTASTTSSGFFSITETVGVSRFIMQVARGFAGVTFGGIWLGHTALTGASNFTIGADSTFTYINSPTGVGGAIAFTLAWNSGAGAFNIDAPVAINRPRFAASRDASFGWNNSTNAGDNNNPLDTAFYRDAVAAVVAFANPTTPTAANSIRVYNTTNQAGTGTAPTVYERGVLDWTTTPTVFTIGTQQAGAAARDVAMVTGGTEIMRLLAASNQIKLSNAASFSANGSVATVLGSLGPVGSHTAVQNWLTFQDSGGVTRYVPCF